jgi:prepilin-type N-terminal cleavage/methylation domain-containing protein
MARRRLPLAPSIGRRSGFSLVEMLVVLFVIGLLASVVVLSMPGDERILRNEAERFAARTIAARDGSDRWRRAGGAGGGAGRVLLPTPR